MTQQGGASQKAVCTYSLPSSEPQISQKHSTFIIQQCKILNHPAIQGWQQDFNLNMTVVILVRSDNW
jgi:hypothetical protein